MPRSALSRGTREDDSAVRPGTRPARTTSLRRNITIDLEDYCNRVNDMAVELG